MKLKRLIPRLTGFEDLPGFIVNIQSVDDCSNCDAENTIETNFECSLDSREVERKVIWFYCYSCYHKWSKQIELEISLKEL